MAQRNQLLGKLLAGILLCGTAFGGCSGSSSGPVPPPQFMKGWNAVVPGSAERILAMAEKDQAHIHDMDRRKLAYPFYYQLTGLIFGGVISRNRESATSFDGFGLGSHTRNCVVWM